ncbi:MAG TPA: ATP-binding protein [Opitutaceae bacterium]|jgi:signal transduction histidine kinase
MSAPGTQIERTLVAAFLGSVPANVYFKDKESRFLAVSASMLRHNRLASPDQIIGKTDFDLFTSDHAGIALADELQIMRTGEPILGKLEREEWADGRITWVVTDKFPLRDAGGDIVGTFGLSKDVTAERDVQASLEEARKELADASRQAGMAEVATGVLHNVGNVLNSLNVGAAVIGTALRTSKATSLSRVSDLMKANADSIGDFLTSDAKGKLVPGFLASLAQHMVEERAKLLDEVEALRTHIDHIKDIVSTQQAYATMAGVTEPLAPAELMEASIRMNSSALARHEVVVTKDYSHVPPVWAERGKVLQILINLIRNAKYALDDRKSGLAPKTITLKIARASDATVSLTVSDNGVGIPAENLAKIFNHGFTTRKQGHGFGLHSSVLAAKEMGGCLTVTSPGASQGAAFTLTLPVAQINAAAA